LAPDILKANQVL